MFAIWHFKYVWTTYSVQETIFPTSISIFDNIYRVFNELRHFSSCFHELTKTEDRATSSDSTECNQNCKKRVISIKKTTSWIFIKGNGRKGKGDKKQDTHKYAVKDESLSCSDYTCRARVTFQVLHLNIHVLCKCKQDLIRVQWNLQIKQRRRTIQKATWAGQLFCK